jgi:hypothetical protein
MNDLGILLVLWEGTDNKLYAHRRHGVVFKECDCGKIIMLTEKQLVEFCQSTSFEEFSSEVIE